MILSRDAILQARELPRKVVSVPEWGGEVIVRTLSGTEMDEWATQDQSKEDRLVNFRSKLVAACLCDEQGKRILSFSDVQKLGEQSALALDRVYDAAASLNGIGKSEAIEKN